MCNIAGYVGTRHAAPILIDMLRKEEGFWAGYYTGIATLYEGKIHYRKLTGDLDRLLTLTDAASLPGTVGIIHGRSKAGGDDEWAHPFIGERNGHERIAYVANGSNGSFTNQKPHQSAVAEALDKAGYVMRSRAFMSNKGYPTFSDGKSVHVSDVMCQLILSHIESGMSSTDAMSAAFCGMPAEIVGLMLSADEPNRIIYSRINEPMSVGFTDHGAYLATAPIAIPDDASEPILLPTCSSGIVYHDSFTAIPYKNSPAEVIPITADMYTRLYNTVTELLSDSERSIPELWENTRQLFDGIGCTQIEAMLYDIVSDLIHTGKAECSVIRVPGQTEELDVPQFMMKLTKE